MDGRRTEVVGSLHEDEDVTGGQMHKPMQLEHEHDADGGLPFAASSLAPADVGKPEKAMQAAAGAAASGLVPKAAQLQSQAQLPVHTQGSMERQVGMQAERADASMPAAAQATQQSVQQPAASATITDTAGASSAAIRSSDGSKGGSTWSRTGPASYTLWSMDGACTQVTEPQPAHQQVSSVPEALANSEPESALLRTPVPQSAPVAETLDETLTGTRSIEPQHAVSLGADTRSAGANTRSPHAAVVDACKHSVCQRSYTLWTMDGRKVGTTGSSACDPGSPLEKAVTINDA